MPSLLECELRVAADRAVPPPQVLESPVLGPLVRRLVLELAPGMDPLEAILPIALLPGVKLPSLFPIPAPERLYFRSLAVIAPENRLHQMSGTADPFFPFLGCSGLLMNGRCLLL
jgi:hypothetical protein